MLAGAALAIYRRRKKDGPRERAAASGPEDWQAWLIGGSVALAAALLLFLEDARSNWGPILGAEALLLAAVVPL